MEGSTTSVNSEVTHNLENPVRISELYRIGQ